MLSTPFVGTAPLSSLGSSPARRADATSLGQWMERELDKLRTDQVRQGTSETHVLKAARAIYSVVFREVARQVTINCAEQGALLSKIFAVHSDLLDGMITERERWKLAEAAAWLTQKQAADAAKLRAQVARMLLSTQQVLATQQDDGLRSAADDAEDGGRRTAGSGKGGKGGMNELLAATDLLRPQGGLLSAHGSSSEGGGRGDESMSSQARLTRTLEMAAGLDRKAAAARSKCHPWQCLSSAPAVMPPQGAPGGPMQLGTPRVRPQPPEPHLPPPLLELAASKVAHFTASLPLTARLRRRCCAR